MQLLKGREEKIEGKNIQEVLMCSAGPIPRPRMRNYLENRVSEGKVEKG